tara:strand:+ start:195889 stop:196125 length:237 start_codon:yes stop_codon:yes gene_type:complete
VEIARLMVTRGDVNFTTTEKTRTELPELHSRYRVPPLGLSDGAVPNGVKISEALGINNDPLSERYGGSRRWVTVTGFR